MEKHLATGRFEEAVKDNIFGNSKGNDWEAEHYDVAIMILSVLDRRMFGAVMRGFAFRYGTFAIVFGVMRIKRAEKI